MNDGSEKRFCGAENNIEEKTCVLIELMDKLIEDLNLISMENAECMTKVSLSPDHGPKVPTLPMDDEFYCVEGRLNYHLDKGE